MGVVTPPEPLHDVSQGVRRRQQFVLLGQRVTQHDAHRLPAFVLEDPVLAPADALTRTRVVQPSP
ncbi:MAG TPA: hypothetical protein VKE73_02480 [Myxococcota bacterium]|nr:hypothetical protein [Myxococcota bacterium]